MQISELNQFLGNIDLYLLDQILKNRFHPQMKVLDAGCGEGRNLMYFMHSGYDLHAIDANEDAVEILRFLIKSKRPDLDPSRVVLGNLAQLPYPEQHFDLVIVSAVLHFAESHDHFQAMFAELIRCLASGGIIFIRMTSDIGLPESPRSEGKGRYAIPDGTSRYLLTREILNQLLKDHPISLIEPLKTVNVQDERCMSTLILRKD